MKGKKGADQEAQACFYFSQFLLGEGLYFLLQYFTIKCNG